MQPLQKIGTVADESGRTVRMSLSPDGRWLATALASGQEMVQPTNGGRARVKTRQGQRVAAFQFSPNGDTVAYQIDQQETLYTIWSLAPGAVLRSGKSLYHAEEVEFNRSGKVLATVPAGTDIADFWNPDDAAQLRSERGMLRAEFSPDGSLLAIQRANGTVDVLEMTGHALLQLQKPVDAEVERFAISWDNRRLAITLSDGSIHVYEITPAGRETVLSGKRGSEVVAFSPDGRVLAVAGSDGVVRLFRFGSRQAMTELPDPHKDRVRQLAFSPDGKRLVSGATMRWRFCTTSKADKPWPDSARMMARLTGWYSLAMARRSSAGKRRGNATCGISARGASWPGCVPQAVRYRVWTSVRADVAWPCCMRIRRCRCGTGTASRC
ncbi:hypothetical protein [Paraburkholderia sp. PGU19]|uniref:WD40 repeat domain-containing protein n=1 Tax=Paraburkholderia sp. PGU19 TaxID=2735434 RepID=UPI001FB0F6F9|nr:hypothetical protein [Paraburkholderia sp. PGU19]